MKRQGVSPVHETAEWEVSAQSCHSRSAQDADFVGTSARGSMDHTRQGNTWAMSARISPCGPCRRRRKTAVDGAARSSSTEEDRLCPMISTSSRRAPRKPGALICSLPLRIALSAAWILLPTTLAVPAPNIKKTSSASPASGLSPTPPPSIHGRRIENMVVTAWPSNVPTSVSILDSTALPYMLTQLENGSWSQIDNAWFLYGRQAGVSRPSLL